MRSTAASFLFSLLLLPPCLRRTADARGHRSGAAYDARNGRPLVSFRMSEASRKAFADFTSQHVNEKIDIRVDGNSVTQVVIREPITGGVGQISATSVDTARQLTERLKAKAPLVVEAIPSGIVAMSRPNS